MKITAVIGKNYGDEGKGLVTASICSDYNRPLIIKYNGGAQAGHTVEDEEKGTRFIHHQIGSGAEYGADTLLAETYYPDLYQIGKEVEEFRAQFGFEPNLFAETQAEITTVDDVLLNMALETKRGKNRHGSCGMGINECTLRNSAGYSISIGEIATYSPQKLYERFKAIRKEYTAKRVEDLEINPSNKYHSLLNDENVLRNFAYEVHNNMSFVKVVTADSKWLNKYDGIIFEAGQGLLLDKDYLEGAPHLTSSKTGVTYVCDFLGKRELELDEAIYVTRSYVTRHGAGPLPNEFDRIIYQGIESDITNEPNEWQGKIRYGRHTDVTEFTRCVLSDISKVGIKPSLAITHLNETDDKILFRDCDMPLPKLCEIIHNDFSTVYISRSRYRFLIGNRKEIDIHNLATPIEM